MISSSDSSTSTDTETGAKNSDEMNQSPLFKEFIEKLSSLATPEEKIAHGLVFMKGAISQEGSPRFREFWEARKLILAFFKENLNPVIRSKLWDEYVELTVEARRLKEILEEQSAFAMEQIDLAIQAIETEVADFTKLLGKSSEPENLELSQIIQQKKEIYSTIQTELNLLNTIATRLNSLRKEIIKTDMRIRFKTKFFKRLSDLGDQIFPKRKELIEKVSAEFEKDVNSFVESYFQGDEVVGAPYYAVREEIKALQNMAKVFTLNSGVFTRTRLALSECWDKVKVLEKEHKKGIYEKKQASFEKREEFQKKIDALKSNEEPDTFESVNEKINQILSEMREVSLHRDDVRYLKDELFKLKEPFIAEEEKKAKERAEKEKEKLQIKREKITALKEKAADFLKNSDKLELDELNKKSEEIFSEFSKLELSKGEKQQIERSLRPIKDLILEKKEQSLLNLSDDDKKAIENLKAVLEKRKIRRNEIKDQLETYRKMLGSSSLDFEKAMQVQELIEQEKIRLEKANAAIVEIEEKISDLENQSE